MLCLHTIDKSRIEMNSAHAHPAEDSEKSKKPQKDAIQRKEKQRLHLNKAPGRRILCGMLDCQISRVSLALHFPETFSASWSQE